MIKKKENILLGVFWVAVSIFLVACSYYSSAHYVGDTALYAQIVNNIAYTGKAESNIYANTQDHIDRGIAAMSVDERLASEEAFTPPVEQSRNILRFHACFILYLLAPLCYFMSSFTCVTIAQSVALALSLLFVILLMREKKIPVPVIGFTCLLLVSHPGWSLPAVYGAFYPERLFMATGMYLIWSCDKEKFSKLHFIISAILCLMVGERGALYAGMFILAHTVFFWKERKEYRFFKLATGLCLVLYTGIMMKFILANIYYSDLGSKLNIMSYLAVATNRQKVALFLLINVAFFAIIALLDWRAFIIGCASMIPNLLYDVGGAEKIGWSLHYHVFYFVFLMWAVARGSTKLYVILEKRLKRKKMSCISTLAVLSIFIGLISLIVPSDLSIDFSKNNVKNNIIFNGANCIKTTYLQGGKELREKYKEFIQSNIPEGSQVTAVEGAMVELSKQQIYIYPVGIDTADAAVLVYTMNNEEPVFGGSVVYGSAEECKRFDEQVVLKMKQLGYDFENAKLYPAYGVAIVEKK